MCVVVAYFLINSIIIAFLFPVTGLPENGILSPCQRNHELIILPSLQLAIGSPLVLDVLEAIWPPLAGPLKVTSGEGPAADTKDKQGFC